MRRSFSIKVSAPLQMALRCIDSWSEELLEGVLFANIRFHDTVSRGRLLNRFGKDFEGESYAVSMFTYIFS